MTRFLIALTLTLAALIAPLTHSGHIARASGGSSTGQTVGLYREGCTTSSALAVGTVRFAPDDQGGIPGGLEIRTGVTAGLPRTTYAVSLLANPCGVITKLGTLTTDDSGRGDLDAHVAASLISSREVVRVQLVAPGDTLTSDPVQIP